MKRFINLVLVGFALCAATVARAELGKPIRVVATLSTFADIVNTIGGDRVQVKTIAAPQFNPHFIEPRPSDVLAVKRADLLVHGGLDLEAWRGPLVDAAGNTNVRPGGGRELDLSVGIALLEVPTKVLTRADGDIHLYGNPHYWVDPRNGLIMAKSIATKLTEIDPEGAAGYEARRAAFDARLRKEIAVALAAIRPMAGRALIGYHNEWVYLVDFLGLTMDQYLEPKPGIPPSGQHLQELIAFAQKAHVGAIVQSTYFSREAADGLSAKTGVPVVELCQSVGEMPECGDYLKFVVFNAQQLATALERKNA